MSKTKIALGVGVGLLALSIFWIDKTFTEKTFTDKTETSEKSDSSPIVAPLSQKVNIAPDQISNSKEEIMEVDDIELSEQINQAIQSYDEISQYPPYSQPIKTEEHLNAFVNSVKAESSLPFPFDGLDQPISASIRLDDYNYFFGELISAKIELSSLPSGATVNAGTQLMTLSGEVLANAETEIVSDDDSHKIFDAYIDTKDYDSSTWPLELNMAVLAEVDGNQIFLTAPFRINSETAELQSVGFSEVQSDHLNIPLNFSVSLAGYYFVSGVLYSKESDMPLVYLEAEGALASGAGSLSLKAHIQALKQGGDEGPYELKDIRVERWSDELIQMDVAGKVAAGEYTVEGYSFDEFDDNPYQDPLKEQRIRLLQGLSSL